MLAGSGLLSRLKSLQLFGNYLSAAGVAELARSPNIDGLEELSLGANNLGDGGLVSLTTSRYLSNLRTLHIVNDDISDKHAINALATSPHLTRLTDLHLHHFEEKPGTARLVAESETLIQLRRLRLNDNDCPAILARLAERRRERGIP